MARNCLADTAALYRRRCAVVSIRFKPRTPGGRDDRRIIALRMEQFLSSDAFRYAVFPLVGAFLGIGIKHVSRNDRYAKFRKEDLAVGIELLLTACLTYVALTSDRAVALLQANKTMAEVVNAAAVDKARVAALHQSIQNLSAHVAMSGWVIALMFLGLWSVSSVVRLWGWKNEAELHGLIGIALPLVMGVLGLIAVMAGAR